MYDPIQALTTLDLDGNNIGDVGAQHFAHALERNAVRLVAQLHI
jgi:sRNA-binding protein